MKISKKVGATLGAVALLAGGSGVALAAIPDSDDGEFHACVANTGPVRAMYAIDAEGSETCAAGYSEKAWGTEPVAKPKVIVIKKTKLSSGSGGLFTEWGTCPAGYVAIATGHKITPSSPQGIGDVDVMVVDNRVNPNGTNDREFVFSGYSRAVGSTSGQVSVEFRATCMSDVDYQGVSTPIP